MATAKQVARLAAGAAAGSDGVRAFDEAQANMQGTRNAAISSLRSDTASVNAPSALLGQLSRGVNGATGTGVGNMRSLGGVQDFASRQLGLGTDEYMREASAALPMIDAEAIRDESQRERLLQAGNAGDSIRAAAARRAAASSGGQLSDSELRTRIMGLAEQQRAQVAGAATGRAQSRFKNISGDFLDASGNPVAPPNLSATQIANIGPGAPGSPNGAVNALVTQNQARRKEIFENSIDKEVARQRALLNIQQAQYGPGITGEATQLALKLGVPSAEAYGLFPPSLDNEYVNANKNLGLYNPGGQVTGQTLSFSDAAKKVGLDGAKANAAASQQFLDFTSPSTAAAFNSWALRADPNGSKYGAGTTVNPNSGKVEINFTDKGLAQAQADFTAAPGSKSFQQNLLGQVLQEGVTAARGGFDLSTFVQSASPQMVGLSNQYPDVFRLALAQLGPVFDYYTEVRTRQAQAPSSGTYPGLDQLTGG